MIRPQFPILSKNMHIWGFSLLLLACGPGPDDNEQSCDTGANALQACTTTGGMTTTGTTGTTTTTTTAPTTTGTTTTAPTTTGTTGTTIEPTSTSETTGGAVACDPNNIPPEGSACANEGEFCSPGCTDQCQFCNIVQCTSGTWQNLEAPPAPCLDCAEICPFTTAPMCPGGAPDDEACILGCEDSKMGRCASEFSALRACAGLTPEFSCDLDGRPVVAGCEAQFAAFYTCAL